MLRSGCTYFCLMSPPNRGPLYPSQQRLQPLWDPEMATRITVCLLFPTVFGPRFLRACRIVLRPYRRRLLAFNQCNSDTHLCLSPKHGGDRCCNRHFFFKSSIFPSEVSKRVNKRIQRAKSTEGASCRYIYRKILKKTNNLTPSRTVVPFWGTIYDD